MEIIRQMQGQIEEKIGQNKVVLLYGSRRVGKTKILKSIHQSGKYVSLLLNGEDENVHKILAERTVANYSPLLNGIKLLIIDEAQNVPQIGLILKLMIDEFPSLTIIASGSSSFDLVHQVGNPLVGRSFTFQLYPVAQMELAVNENPLQIRENLSQRLIFGSYPEVVTLLSAKEKADYLLDLVNGYLLKDILAIDTVSNSSKLLQLLQLVAWQVGSEVSYEELGKQLGLSRNTVERYLDLLTKVFVIQKVTAFSSNLRKEITKPCKWYFSDNGLRNALIGDFNPLPTRKDVGALWENYILMERVKYNAYSQNAISYFFWRTYDGQEIDLIEKNLYNTHIEAFECKWNPLAKSKVPNYFQTNYPQVPVQVIHPDNYLSWILEKNLDSGF